MPAMISHHHQQQLNKSIHETWFGFIKEKKDAQILVDACAANLLTPIRELSPSTSSTLEIRSGSVIILQETSTTPAQKTRWRDSFSWSSSRISGAFLLYRQVEPSSTAVKNHTVVQREKSSLFITTSVRGNTRLIPNGLAKRTITLTAQSTGEKFRVISYFYPHDVEQFYSRKVLHQGFLQTPSQAQEFQDLIAVAHQAVVMTSKSLTIESRGSESLLSPITPSVSDWSMQLHKFETDSLRFGGTGVRAASLFFRKYPNWTDFPVTLAPLGKANKF
ncbi:hypothetical protein CcCBS67573_g07737 [Chytriomyces confervae]|uniref:Uncharacterized protein n=1 Tax=Chytriomyces confervae TaxID=246404 RepID=A0A507ETJ6_9FUNG|nr:hypothetical protein HDU80_000103 [Chytriomyces hyalinus]TPX66675.1 hypothetical protein CcCBS67573_g07737 [Chytriomyces confervae]